MTHRFNAVDKTLIERPNALDAHLTLWTIAWSVLGTLVIVILVLNFRKPEKEPQHRVARHYNILDPQFRREMGVLLGPAIVPGNRIEALAEWR